MTDLNLTQSDKAKTWSVILRHELAKTNKQTNKHQNKQTNKQTTNSTNISIYKFGLSGCLFVCLYPINVKTAEPIGPNFFVGHYVTIGKVYEC